MPRISTCSRIISADYDTTLISLHIAFFYLDIHRKYTPNSAVLVCFYLYGTLGIISKHHYMQTCKYSTLTQCVKTLNGLISIVLMAWIIALLRAKQFRLLLIDCVLHLWMKSMSVQICVSV